MNLESILKLADNVDGVFVDIGTGWANDARKIIDLMSKETIKKRKGFLFDSFEGIPEPTSKDLKYIPDLKKGSRKIPPQQAFDSRFLLPGYDIKVVKGYVEDTLPSALDNLKIGIGYIDLGTYSSTYNALKLIVPFLNEYATVIIYDSKTTNAVSDAVNNFLLDTKLQYLKNIDDNGTIYLRKIKPPVYFSSGTVSKSRNDKVEARVESRATIKHPAFEDRYEKEIIPEFIPKQEIKKGLQVIHKKVSK